MQLLINRCWWIIALLIIGILVNNALLPIHYDEAYYWLWGQRLDFGYFDHPPMVGYVIWLTTLISDQVFWVRLGAVVCNLLALWFFHLFVRDLYNRDTARLAALLLAVLPIVQINSTIITPDAPLALFWSLGLFTCWRALAGRSGYWYPAGIAIGLMVASKLMAVFFIFPLCLYILWRRRELLMQRRLYLAACLSLLPAIGMLYWNSRHGWPNILYQIYRSGTDDLAFHLIEYFGGYLLIFTPVLLWLAVDAVIKRASGGAALLEGERLLLLIAFCMFVFFLVKAVRSGSEPNWVGPMVFLLLPLIAKDLLQHRRQYTALAAVACALLLSLLVRLPWVTGFEYAPSRVNYALAAGIDRFAGEVQSGETLCSDYHTTASALIHRFGNTNPVILRFATRPSQFDLWPDSNPASCRALVQRGELKDYHRRDCASIRDHREFSIALDKGYHPTFQTFICDLNQGAGGL